VIKKSKTAFPIHTYIVEHNVGIEVEELPPGILAKFDDLGNAIIIDPAAKAEPAKVVAQYLVHEGEHARWYPVDSIYQEYHAFKAEADFWNEVRKGTAHETCDWVAGFVGQGKRAAMDYIRTIPGNQHFPTYALLHDDLEQAADILDDTKHGQPAFLATQRKGVEFTFATNARGAFAWYWIHENKGAIDPDFQDEHPKVLAACLAYLTMRAAWDCGDSIDQELSSFKAMARIWGDIRRDLTHSFLDLVRSTAKLGDDPLRTWIRRQPEYSDLPESYP